MFSYRSTPGCAGLFGLPFFLAGCFFFYIGLTTDEINGGPPSVGLRAFFCAFSSIFILVGAALLSGFSKVVVDPKRKEIIRSSGLLWFLPVRWKKQALGSPVQIQLKKTIETVSTKNGTRSYTVYLVEIEMQGGEKEEVLKIKDKAESRGYAEEIAKLFHLPVLDQSSGEDVLRKADELDRPLGSAVREEEGRVQMPRLDLDSPLEFKAKVMPGEEDSLQFPSLASENKMLAKALIGLWSVLALLLIWHWGDPAFFGKISQGIQRALPIEDIVLAIVEKLFSFFIVILIGWIKLTQLLISRGFVKVELSFNNTHLKLIRKWGPLSRTQEMAFNELEELHVDEKLGVKDSRGRLTAVSDRRSLIILEFHPIESVRFAEKMIKYMASRR